MIARRLRVLHVIQNLNYGGMERLIAELIGRSDRSRFEHHVLVFQYLGRFSRDLEGLAGLHQTPPLGAGSMLWPGSVIRLMRALRPDVVHSHSGVWYKASLASRLARVPWLIHTEHGRQAPDPLGDRMVDGLASRRTDVVVAVSEPLARQLAATVVRGRSARIVVVRNGVDTDRFAPQPDNGSIRRELGIPAAAAVIGSIGRLEPIKGYDVMLEAFARLLHAQRAGHPPYLVVGGDGSERGRLAERIERDDTLRRRVHLLGWRDDVEDLLATFLLFTMASRSEGTSVSLLEAMSSGLCPIVTDVGGNAAVLGPSLRHRLVPAENPDALAHAWRAAIDQPAELRADGVAARERLKAEFGLEAMVRTYEALYERRIPVRQASI